MDRDNQSSLSHFYGTQRETGRGRDVEVQSALNTMRYASSRDGGFGWLVGMLLYCLLRSFPSFRGVVGPSKHVGHTPRAPPLALGVSMLVTKRLGREDCDQRALSRNSIASGFERSHAALAATPMKHNDRKYSSSSGRYDVSSLSHFDGRKADSAG